MLPVIKKNPIDFLLYKKNLETSLHEIRDEFPYIGFILQCLHIKAHTGIPTAGVAFNKKAKKFEMMINPNFFNKMTAEEQKAVLLHEIYHLTHKHVYMMYKYKSNDRKMLNCAMDLVINQLINNLPKQALTLKGFKEKYGVDLKANQTTEYYFEQLKKAKDEGKFDKKDGDQGDEEGQGGGPETLDEHDWQESEEDSEEAMKASKDLFQRAKQKASLSHSNVPREFEDLIEDLEVNIKKLNYKKLLDLAYFKSLPNTDRQPTWSRPNKRYFGMAPGSKANTSPKIDTYLDTSGSISVDEFNFFMRHNDKFLKFTNKKCQLYYFHTSLYHTEKYKVGKEVDRTNIKIGGTDLQETIDNIIKKKADLAIIFTDGCYNNVVTKGKVPPILFVISENGQVDHPLKHLGTTVKFQQ